jgi:hypothetical protein
MYNEQMDPDIKSQFSKQTRTYASLESSSLLPIFGLRAAALLDDTQMKKLALIREKKLKSAERKRFMRD